VVHACFGAGTMTAALRMFSGGAITAFPIGMYADAFAAPDSTNAGTAAADSVVAAPPGTERD